MQNNTTADAYFGRALTRPPQAIAQLAGDAAHPWLWGIVRFYQLAKGVLLCAHFTGLPVGTGICRTRVFGLHIHEQGDCSGNPPDPFANTEGHYNPSGCAHPAHAGDLPPLIADNGRDWFAFYPDRFSVREILGRSVVVHAERDDFTTQPSGNSGSKIGCGIIQRADTSRICGSQHIL